MPQFQVATPQRTYAAVVERNAIARVGEFLPAKCGRIFIVTEQAVWNLHGSRLSGVLPNAEVLFFEGGEEHKRMSHVESFAEQMVEKGADRSSIVVAFGGGIVTDLGGFLAAIFMRGIPVIQIPTTLLAQVDAAVGGKTGTNLVAGKNLVGAFHQPLAVLTDPEVLGTLSDREFRAGLYEIIKAGVIRDAGLFATMAERRDAVLAREPQVLEEIIAASVGMKAEVVTADERESGLRRILNFGHTFGHALEAETKYTRFLHGEAVSWGMRAATYLAADLGMLPGSDRDAILRVLNDYGPIPSLAGIRGEALQARLVKDKKTIQSRVHFVLPVKIGEVEVRADIDEASVRKAIETALADCI